MRNFNKCCVCLQFFQPQCDHPVGETKLSENHLQYETNYANGCFQQVGLRF